MHSLQWRSKWHRIQGNVSQGDTVLLVGCQWRSACLAHMLKPVASNKGGLMSKTDQGPVKVQ